MFKTSSKSNYWFQERTPDFYFWIIGIISIVVVLSAYKMFANMQSKNKEVSYKYSTWQKWTILGLATLLSAMLVTECIYRYIAYYQVVPYHTSFSWKFNLYTSFTMLIMLALWIFKGIINKQWIEWRKEFFSWKLAHWFFKKINKESVLVKYGGKNITSKKNISKPIIAKKVLESVLAPVSGETKDITKVKDEVFSKKLMGDGIAIIPSSGEIYSPVDGTVESAFHTGHAFGIKTDNGLSLLIHIGIDTVKLNGKGFKTKVKQGDRVKKGDLLSIVNLATIKKARHQTDVIVIVLPESNKKIQPGRRIGKILKNNLIFKVK